MRGGWASGTGADAAQGAGRVTARAVGARTGTRAAPMQPTARSLEEARATGAVTAMTDIITNRTRPHPPGGRCDIKHGGKEGCTMTRRHFIQTKAHKNALTNLVNGRRSRLSLGTTNVIIDGRRYPAQFSVVATKRGGRGLRVQLTASRQVLAEWVVVRTGH